MSDLLYFNGINGASGTYGLKPMTANVLGLIALLFACFGGGTPKLDQFARQAFKDEREVIAPNNFIGGLPKRLLSQGALAVIGHVERVWGYSFLSPGAGQQTGVFEGTLHQLFSGDPVGWVTENLNIKYADLATELATILDELELQVRKPCSAGSVSAWQVVPCCLICALLHLYNYSRKGSWSGESSTLILRACPGTRLMNPFSSSLRIIWWTVGGVTRKYRWISASAGGRRLTFV